MRILALHIFLLIISNSAFPLPAQELAVPSALCRCDVNQNDRLEGPGQINFGAYSGVCFDTCRYRQSLVLAQSGLKSPARETVLSNYMHDGRYWTASIPAGAVKSVQIGFEEFLPGISHVFLIFDFAEGHAVRLKAQGSVAQKMTVDNLVISPEGIPPKDGKYNLADAYFERYPIGIRALSRRQVIEHSVEDLKHKVRVYDLTLNSAQANELLRLAIESIDQKSFRVKYGLLSNNCATQILDMIDTVSAPDKSKYPIYYSWIYRFERALPIAGPLGTLQIFLSRHLIGDRAGHSITD